MPPLHIALAVFVMLVWGLTFIAIRIGLDHFPPLMFAALRFALASLPFLAFVRRPRVDWRRIVGIGLFLGVGQFGLLFVGMELGMPPGLSSVIVQTQAFFTVLFAILILGERPTWQNMLGLLLAFAGVLVIGGHLGAVPMVPFLLVIFGAVFWGVANIIIRGAGSSDALHLIVWSSAVSPLPLLAMSWAIEGGDRIVQAVRDLSWAGVGALAVVSFAATNVAYGLWSFLLQRHPAASVAPYALLVPLFGMAASAFVFGEIPSVAKLLGAALIVAGVAANSWPSRRAEAVPAASD